jgi:hypothetical protein
MMKATSLFLSILFLIGCIGGCGQKKAGPNPSVVRDIAVLTLEGEMSGLTADQTRELSNTVTWMDRDLIKNLNTAGFRAVLIKNMHEYKSDMGKLLIAEVERFNAGNRAARALVGFGAGAASLDLRYKLLDERGGTLAEWRDGVGSSKGATYCAETLNRRAVDKVISTLK